MTDTRPILQAILVELRTLCRAMGTLIGTLEPRFETEAQEQAEVRNAIQTVYHTLTNYNRILDEDIATNPHNDPSSCG